MLLVIISSAASFWRIERRESMVMARPPAAPGRSSRLLIAEVLLAGGAAIDVEPHAVLIADERDHDAVGERAVADGQHLAAAHRGDPRRGIGDVGVAHVEDVAVSRADPDRRAPTAVSGRPLTTSP